MNAMNQPCPYVEQIFAMKGEVSKTAATVETLSLSVENMNGKLDAFIRAQAKAQGRREGEERRAAPADVKTKGFWAGAFSVVIVSATFLGAILAHYSGPALDFMRAVLDGEKTNATTR